MLRYEKVLCPTAFHPNCFEALEVARRCVDREGGTLYLLHVLHRVDPRDQRPSHRRASN
jgi:nucleotide-binding universal stress UspA family protein